MDNANKEPDYELIEQRLKGLLKRNEFAVTFFKFLSGRERHSEVSDVNLLVTYLNPRVGGKRVRAVSRQDLLDILEVFTACGIGILRNAPKDLNGKAGRLKFHWQQWVFPIFDKFNPNRLIGLEVKPVSYFTGKRNHLKVVKQQVESYAIRLSGPIPDPTVKLDVSLDLKPAPAPITEASLSGIPTEKLLAELAKRNAITISVNKNTEAREESKKKKK